MGTTAANRLLVAPVCMARQFHMCHAPMQPECVPNATGTLFASCQWYVPRIPPQAAALQISQTLLGVFRITF
jgi:hypothetical protein